MLSLYHYTCPDHGLPGITRDGKIRPNPQPLLGGWELSWYTDLEVPDRAALGLTMNLVSCDRTAYRFEVSRQPEIVPWTAFRRLIRGRVPASGVEALEGAPGALLRHWWVSEVPVRVEGPGVDWRAAL